MNLHPSLRQIDADDLIMLVMLHEKKRCTQIASRLGITPAAISHRLRKLDEFLPGLTTSNTKRSVMLTSKGKVVALLARDFLQRLDYEFRDLSK